MNQPQPAPAATPLDLDAIQARCDAATPGPWWADDTEIIVGTPDDLQPHPVWIGETANPGTPNGGLTNAQFIAAARTDVEQLIARVRELASLLAEMTQCRDAALRALYRDDVDTDIDIEDTITNALHGPGWDWDDERTPGLIARDVAPEIRPALAKATQQRDEALARVRELEAENLRLTAEVERLSADRAEVRSAIALDLMELHDDPATADRYRAGLRAAARRIPVAQDGGY